MFDPFSINEKLPVQGNVRPIQYRQANQQQQSIANSNYQQQIKIGTQEMC